METLKFSLERGFYGLIAVAACMLFGFVVHLISELIRRRKRKPLHQILSDQLDKTNWKLKDGKIVIAPEHLKESMVHLVKLSVEYDRFNIRFRHVVLLAFIGSMIFTFCMVAYGQQPKHHAGTPFIIQQDTIASGTHLYIHQLYRVAGSMNPECKIIEIEP